jgi:hypothetical protein
LRKEVKKLLKKYPSLKDELIELIESLESNPNQGTVTNAYIKPQ